jgi:transcriptional regulator with XRE-family HTH domain
MKLRKLRTEKGISQTALAKKARISREHLNRLEAGCFDPAVGVVQRLAKALGVPLMELLG